MVQKTLIKLVSFALVIVGCGTQKVDTRTHIPQNSFGNESEIVIQPSASEEAQVFRLRAVCTQSKSLTEKLEFGVFAMDGNLDSAITLTRNVKYTIHRNEYGKVVGHSKSIEELPSPKPVSLALGEDGSFSVNANANTQNLGESIFLTTTSSLELISRKSDGEEVVHTKLGLTDNDYECEQL